MFVIRYVRPVATSSGTQNEDAYEVGPTHYLGFRPH